MYEAQGEACVLCAGLSMERCTHGVVEHGGDELREERGGVRVATRGERPQQARGRVVDHLAHQRQASAPHSRAARAKVPRAEHRHQPPATYKRPYKLTLGEP